MCILEVVTLRKQSLLETHRTSRKITYCSLLEWKQFIVGDVRCHNHPEVYYFPITQNGSATVALPCLKQSIRKCDSALNGPVVQWKAPSSHNKQNPSMNLLVAQGRVVMSCSPCNCTGFLWEGHSVGCNQLSPI